MDYESLTVLQAFRRWPRISIYSFCLALNILLWGFDTGIVGGMTSLSAFRKEFGEKGPVGAETEYIIPAMWLALWAMAFPLGTMTGAVTGAWIQDRTGRKSTLGLGCLLSLGAITIAYLSDQTANPTATYWAAKFTQGIAVGVLMASTQTYLAEVVPARLRGPIMALFPAFQLLGQLVAAVVIMARGSVKGPSSYRIAIASEYPLSIIPLVLTIVLPESPVWLLRKGKMAAAQNSFRKLHGAKVAAAHQDLFEEMNKAISEERWASNDRGASYMECFRGTNLRRTMIVVFSNGMSEIMGFNILGSVSYFLQLLGLPDMASLIVAIIGILLGLSANIGSFWTLLKFGRRPLILYTLGLTSLLWLSVGIAGCFKGIAVAWYAVGAMMAVVVTVGIGCWPASFVVAAETSSLTLRSKTSGIGWFLGGIIQGGFGCGTPFLYNPDAADLGGKTAFVFAGTSAVGVLITWFFIPELKGKSAIEIDRVFQKHGGSVKRANTSGFERVDSEDAKEIPLTQTTTRYSRAESTASNGSYSAPPVQAWEPLRKRPTF
ncbi:uncharacterized protein LTR77_004627 [Saxophila tyrrhenica]|uniref:Major facilitator superfamily (MFS) profile domain-containing protein n=1 Tax=Saxophila tyrrhenica TaxID=1690608 RepID=A0AAV9PDB1_9PEZI|nr:hypothetical protein LTR77_004627 [Saxophila tyrrhenica]